MTLDAVLGLLACPLCAAALTRIAGALGCGNGHRFDVARQGHASLLGRGSRTDTGDTADMVAARQEFLDAGHFAPLTAALADAAGDGPVLDLGAGPGHHLAAVLDRGPADRVGLAIDASTYAARRAARVHPRVGSVVADGWSRLPVRDHCAGTVLSVFAPRDPAELARVLHPGGRVVVVTPTPAHQAELRHRIPLLTVEPGKADRLRERMGALRAGERHELHHQMWLTRDDVDRLIRMGPSAYHLPPDRRRAAIAALDDVTRVTLAVTISVFTTLQ